jgi:hypothetical protein
LLLPEDVALPLDAAGENEGTGIVGGPVGMGQRDLGVQHLVATLEIVAAKHRRDELLARTDHAAEGNRAFGRQQVAMLPAQLDPYTFAGTIAGLAGDRPHWRRLKADSEIDQVAVGTGDRPDRDHGDQAGVDQRLAQVLDQGCAVGVAFVKARNVLDMVGAEQRRFFDDDPAEAAGALGLDRHHQAGGAGLVVDEDFGLADLGKGVSAAAELAAQRSLRGGHPRRIDRILLGDGERLAQRRGVCAGCFLKAGQADFGKAVDRARLDVQGYRESVVADSVDLGGHQRIIIAIGAEQLGKQLGIGAGAAVDLGGIGRIVAIFLEGG